MGWPQYAYLFLVALGMGFTLASFGQQKTDRYDFFDLLIGPGLALGILYAGGFFGGGACP